jgi:hypothetical protein
MPKSTDKILDVAYGPIVVRPNGGVAVVTIPSRVSRELGLTNGDEAMVTFHRGSNAPEDYSTITFTFVPNNNELVRKIEYLNWKAAGKRFSGD